MPGNHFFTRIYKTLHILLSSNPFEAVPVRFELWKAAITLIQDNPWIGYGQVNERIVLQQITGLEFWYRAHQTYMSFLIGGGIPALISFGILISGLIPRGVGAAHIAGLPALLALVLIPCGYGMVESTFQAVAVVQFLLFVALLVKHEANRSTAS